jgi:photosystem II stability/assembly factor-like uncharacterized protein
MHRLGGPGSILSALVVMAATVVGVAATLAPPATAAPFTSPDGLWTWSRPLPHGYPANSISAAAPGTLFVATSVSDLLATTDGGARWTWNRTTAVPGFASTQGVQFVSPQEGWAWGADTTGKNGVLLHTPDGGATWQSNLTLPGLVPLTVRFADPQAGWVVAGSGFQSLGYVLTTTDGGQTWSAPVALPRDLSLHFQYTFIATLAPQGGDAAVLMENNWFHGRVYGTTVWRTTDGGATWLTPTTLKGADLGDATFSSATKGWATGASWLWRTTDGGASWHRVRRSPPDASVTTVGNDVWVISGIARPSGLVRSGALHSTDGGKTWQELPGLRGELITFSDPANGWIANGNVYLHTTDGGKSWQHLTTAPKPGVRKLAAVADDTVWGAAGRVIKSRSGGRHWVYTTKRNVTAVAAFSALQAWAVGGKGLVIHTSDGGHHWIRQPSGVTVDLDDIFFVDGRHGWAGGDNGTLLRTTDGGRQWTHTRPTEQAAITQVDFADARHGIALLDARNRGNFLVTSDGGRTWSTKHVALSRDVPSGVIMRDASHALIIALNQFSRVVHSWTSSDGGKTWQRGADLPQPGSYVSIARSGSLLCAVSLSGGVATSRDDGATWSDDGTPGGWGMWSVQFVGANTLMIGGEFGLLTRNLTTAPLP